MNVIINTNIKQALIKDVKIVLVESQVSEYDFIYTCQVKHKKELTTETIGNKKETALQYFDLIAKLYKDNYKGEKCTR